MPLIDDKVRAAFPGLTDDEIRQFHAVASKAAAGVVDVLNVDLNLAIIVRELGWEALKDYLTDATGDCKLSYIDIHAIATASSLLSMSERASIQSAIFGAAGEATSKKTVAARNKSLKTLTNGLSNFEVIEV